MFQERQGVMDERSLQCEDNRDGPATAGEEGSSERQMWMFLRNSVPQKLYDCVSKHHKVFVCQVQLNYITEQRKNQLTGHKPREIREQRGP